MEIDVKDIAASFLAADKYLVYKFREELSKYLKEMAHPLFCFGIYDQLNKIKYIDDVSECLPFEYFDYIIQTSTLGYFGSASYLQMNQDSLIKILKNDTMNVSEIDLLKACVNWVDAEVKRKNLEPTTENTRKIFEPLKQFICFSQINDSDLKKFKKIQQYLDPQDCVDFFLNSSDLSSSSRLDFERKRERLERSRIGFKLSKANCSYNKVEFTLKVSQPFSVSCFYSYCDFLDESNKLYEDDKEIDFVFCTGHDGDTDGVEDYGIYPSTFLILKPNFTYKFKFKFRNIFTKSYGSVKEDKNNKGNLVVYGNHCFHSICGYFLKSV